MSFLTDITKDWPFVLFVAAFFFGVASLLSGDLILLAVGLICAVVGNILEKKEAKK